MSRSLLIDFHLEKISVDGLYLYDFANLSNDVLENKHDYIQWLFPLPEKSFFNTKCQVLDEETLKEFQTNEDLQDSLRFALGIMLKFYKESRHWVTKYNHNYLRISRIIRCLALVGLIEEAEEFYSFILSKVLETEVDANTLKYWDAAVKGELPLKG